MMCAPRLGRAVLARGRTRRAALSFWKTIDADWDFASRKDGCESIQKRAVEPKQGRRTVNGLGVPRIRHDTRCRAVIVKGREWQEKLNRLQRESRWGVRIGVDRFADQEYRPAKRAWLVVFGRIRAIGKRAVTGAACRHTCHRRVNVRRRQYAACGGASRADNQYGKCR